MRLDAIAPWTSVDEVLEKMEFAPLMADSLGHLDVPNEEELNIIRADIDPGGLSTGRGEWMTIDSKTGKRAN